MIDRPAPVAPEEAGRRPFGISRGSVYYLPRPVPAADLAVMLSDRPSCISNIRLRAAG